MRRSAAHRLVALLLILCACVPAPADEGKGGDRPVAEMTPVSSPDGRFRLALPASWKVQVRAGNTIASRVLSLWVTVPGTEGRLKLSLFHLNGIAEPLQQAYTERPVVFVREKAERAWVEPLPTPHLLLDLKQGETAIRLVHIYRLVRGNGFTLAAEGPRTLWPLVADQVLAAISSLETTLGPWPPPPPASYRASKRDGYSYFAHPAVKKRDITAYHRQLRKLERAFQKRHGKFQVGEENPATFVFHDTKARAQALEPEAAQHRTGHLHQLQQRRVFAVPFDSTQDTARADLGYALWGLFYWLRYGCAQPDWMYEGETMLAHDEGLLDQPLPAVSSWTRDQPPIPRPFDELEALREKEYDLYRKTCALYVALFRIGPPEIRSAYRKFLKAVGEGQDWEGAAVEHLYALDPKDLQEEARKLLEHKLSVGAR